MKKSNESQDDGFERLSLDEVTSDSRQIRQRERRQAIVQTVMKKGAVRIEALADSFDISLMTVHRDLDGLAKRGLLRKERGLATVMSTSLNESWDLYRSGQQSLEKRAIARAAVEMIEPGETVFLDDSTTVLQMAPFLYTRTPLTIITNSFNLMNKVRDMDDIALLGMGGRYHNWCNAFLGRMTANEVLGLRADVLFASTAAVCEGVAYHQSAEMIETKQAMFKSASKKILLADHTKFTQHALHRFEALSEFDMVVVDSRTDSLCMESLRENNITVKVVPI